MGCGWLGLPLAKSLLADGFAVYGTTTSSEKLQVLTKAGIHAFHISISEQKVSGAIDEFLKPCNVLIINVPPGLRGNRTKTSYIEKMQRLLECVKESPVKKVIFVSSTSVYGDEQGEVTEETTPIPTTESGKQLLNSEQLFKSQTHFKSTVLRFGGLIGPDRHPINMLSGKENLKNGDAPVNLIHRNDCIRILKQIIHEKQWGETINAVHPEHPTKRVYYTQIAVKKHLPPPRYSISAHKNYKIINSRKFFLTKNRDDFTSL